MVNSGTKAAPKAFKLNPNAPSFVPVAKKIPVEWLNVEEFSAPWYALMNTSAEYQQYWEKTGFQDEEDLFAGDMQALHDLDALVESELAKQQVVGNKASTRSSTGAGIIRCKAQRRNSYVEYNLVRFFVQFIILLFY